jgi:hypothetical protein
VVDTDDEDDAGAQEPAKSKGDGGAFRGAAAATILLTALLTAALSGLVTDYVVGRDRGADQRDAEARATARVYLPEYQRALAGLQAMKKQGRAYVYRVDTDVPLADRKTLAFSAKTSELAAIADTQLKLRDVWPAGATAPASATALKRRWKRNAALRKRVADALTSVNQAVTGLRRVAG